MVHIFSADRRTKSIFLLLTIFNVACTHQIFLKRASYEKIIFSFTSANIPKLKKISILELWPTYPFFCVISHSCLSKVIENVTNRILIPKNLYSQIFKIKFKVFDSFKLFAKKFQRPYSQLLFFTVFV